MFKVGDTIIGKSNNYNVTKKGWIGYVLDIDNNYDTIIVHMYKDSQPYDGWRVNTKDFELISNSNIILNNILNN